MHAPFLILETGTPVAALRRHGGFPHWIRVAAGLHRDEAVVVDVREDAPPSREGFAGVIVTGSAAMVTESHAWSHAAGDWLKAAANAGFPVLGICYGHQLLAHALGGQVGDNPAGREMGTVRVALTAEAATDPLFNGLPPVVAAQVTHLQTVLAPPPGATVLAASDQDACMAFRGGERAWGVQFHPEFSATHMRGYVHARASALRDEGRDVDALCRTIRATPVARSVLHRFIRLARAN